MNQNQDNQSVLEQSVLKKIRPELNLEKWSVWQPARSKNAPQVRTFQREISFPDGSKTTAKVEIGFTNHGVLTTEDQKTYYALVKLWEEQGRSLDPVQFSLQQLAKHLNKKWGTNVINSLTQSLKKLRVTPFHWENSYFNTSNQETMEVLDTFTILSDLKIATRKKDGITNEATGYFRFNDYILKNLQNNHSKPLFFHVVINFKSEIAQLLYIHVDLILSNKDIYERRSKELFEDLGLTGEAYDKKRSKRKQVLEPALAELQGVPLSKGGVIHFAAVLETKDKDDYKVVFRRGTHPKVPVDRLIPVQDGPRRTSQLKPAGPPPSTDPTLDFQGPGTELLRYFNQVFFKVDTRQHQARHLELAHNLVILYGLDLAKHIVDFSHSQASLTNFPVATFGGITQYIDRAIADFHARATQPGSVNPVPETNPPSLDPGNLEYAYQAYVESEVEQYITETFSTETYSDLIEAKKTALLASNRNLYSKWQEDALVSFADAQIRHELASKMDLLCFEEFCQRENND